MDGVLKRVEELEAAVSTIAEVMREMGGDGIGDRIANATIYLRAGGYTLALYAREGMIRIETGDSGSYLSFERRPEDV